MCELFVFDQNTWYYMTVYKQMFIEREKKRWNVIKMLWNIDKYNHIYHQTFINESCIGIK